MMKCLQVYSAMSVPSNIGKASWFGILVHTVISNVIFTFYTYVMQLHVICHQTRWRTQHAHYITRIALVRNIWRLSCFLIGVTSTIINKNKNRLALRWMSLDHTDDKSTQIWVTDWCRHATIHQVSQSWPTSMSQYVVARSQLVKGVCFN